MKGPDTTLNPYLAFNGNCREAMTIYKEALNGELNIQTFGESPLDVPPEHKDKVMHATLTFGDAILMASYGMHRQIRNGLDGWCQSPGGVIRTLGQ